MFPQSQLIAVILLILAVICKNLLIRYLFAAVLVGHIGYVYGDFIYRSYLTLNRDLSGLYLILCLKWDLSRRMRQDRGLHEIFLEHVRKHPNKDAVTNAETGQTLTFDQLNRLANRFANYFQERGYRSGDVVALFFENSVEFAAAWIGCAKLGVVSAWINSNLKAESLAHCVKTSNAKAVICSTTLQHPLKAAIDARLMDQQHSFTVHVYGEVTDSMNATDISKELNEIDDEEPKLIDEVHFKNVLCFIYTSGTTGMPKAAVIKHFRYYSMVMGAAWSFGVRSTDRVYVPMPMYHTAAGILGIGQMLLLGASAVVRRKFSASNFWKDCVRHNCTVSQYIGEICRYLLAQPESIEERTHSMRLLYGNGLRAEIWQEFVDRFGVKIGELYGSTEGTSNLVNIDSHVGACGFLPISPLTKKLHPVRLIKVDDETGEVLRDKDGLCMACNPGETGAMVSTIRKNNPMLNFEGYVNKQDTSKKVITDVFVKGDSCFVSGDILHWDRLGYVYFKDRTGDTYRWKGENVSTTEVEAIIQPMKNVADSTVYGVTVPGMEGRAGMAAVVKKSDQTNEEFVGEIGKRLSENLPSYAVPVFLRLCNRVDKTGTYKLKKTSLQQASFYAVKDEQVFYWNQPIKRYTILDVETIDAIRNERFSRL